MRLIIIRHGEPDYANNTVTEKGHREAVALSERIKKWNVKQFYSSPYGRAYDTAKPTLELLGREAIILPWAKEFDRRIKDVRLGIDHLSWDFVPTDWAEDPKNYTVTEWMDNYPFCDNPDIKREYYAVINGLDSLLDEYGYTRDGMIYRTHGRPERYMIKTVGPDATDYAKTINDEQAQPTIVIFCHFGVACLMLSHLLNIPFLTLPNGIFMPPSSVTVVNTEERWGNQASFRAQCIGDTSHLYHAGEPVSSAGSFTKAFQF